MLDALGAASGTRRAYVTVASMDERAEKRRADGALFGVQTRSLRGTESLQTEPNPADVICSQSISNTQLPEPSLIMV